MSFKEKTQRQKKYRKQALDFNPDLDYNDLKLKAEKIQVCISLGLEDKVKNVEYPREWCAGTTAIHLACQQGATKVYMLGFDLSSYDSPLNNIYKGSNNYLPEYAKGFNPVNWNLQLGSYLRRVPRCGIYLGESCPYIIRWCRKI